jgi:hypothetical protein
MRWRPLAVNSLLHSKISLHGTTITPQKTAAHQCKYWQFKNAGYLFMRGKNAQLSFSAQHTKN